MLPRPNCYSFNLEANFLIVKMVTIIHSGIGQFINLALTRVITQIGLAAYVRLYGGATIREDGSGKEGDQG